MSSLLPPNHAVTIRPATRDDFPAIARLLMQLYAVELPGALHGAQVEQQELLHFTLAAKDAQGLQGRYVACDAAGDVVATATVEYPGATPYDRAPDGTISQAVKHIGYAATARLLLVVARSLVPVPRPRTPDAVWIHSVVVDEGHRGQGIGQAIMTAVEEQTGADGYQTAWLQVLAMNQPARRLYQQFGYTVAWTPPRWQQMLTWPSYLLVKRLAVAQ